MILPSGRHVTEKQLCDPKITACRALTISVKDTLVDTVAEHEDPATAWEALRALYQNGDPSMVLFVTNQLHQIKLSEEGLMEDYLNKARELKNRMMALGELVSDCTLVQAVFNGLPQSYEYVISILTHNALFPTFDRMSAMLLTEHYRLQHRKLHLCDEEALLIQFQQGAQLST